MSNPWSGEWWRIGAIVVVGFLIGLLFGHPGLFVAVGLAIYVGWHLRQIYRLERWLAEGRVYHPPESTGVWGEVFDHVYRMQQRNRARKRRLAGILSQYQKATSALPDATVVLGAAGEIQWFNEAARTLLGFNPAHDTGQRIDNLIRHPSFTAYMAAGAHGVLEVPAPRNARITLSIRMIPYGDEQRLLVARDISEKRRLDEMRRDFIGNVSHELRTPLTVIAGFLETLAEIDAESDDATRARTVTLMRQQTARMQSLVDDLLLLSRLENDANLPPREPVAVGAMLAVLCQDARVLSGDKAHVFELDLDADLGLWGVERELYSAFNNIITNAMRYTPAGGRITVRWHADAQGALFSVTDSGIGIAPEHIPRITERFYRVDPGRSRESGGTGLGLAIVKHVLQRHDAQLLIESTPGQGSTFSCRFPPGLTVYPRNGIVAAS